MLLSKRIPSNENVKERYAHAVTACTDFLIRSVFRRRRAFGQKIRHAAYRHKSQALLTSF